MNIDDIGIERISLKDGIEVCDDKCKCGGNLRLHTYTFGKKTGNLETKFYIDCTNHCGCVSDWKTSPDEAIDAFDKEYSDGK